ncbi:MAG: C45 family peptidase [Proteobacteria bacterium]|nr:C45 family peptidase [Pseudomonadota bacterium]
MGFEHGRVLNQQITANLSLYMEMIRGNTGTKEKKILEQALEFLPVLQETAPLLVEEMEGIARGARVPIESILVLNARTELMSGKWLTGECTAIGLAGQRTADGRPLLAQNWDWTPRSKIGAAFFIMEPIKGPRALIFGEAGQVGKIGLNEAGLGVLLNILVTGDLQTGLPVHVLLRMILNEVDANGAVACIKNADRASASHFLLGDVEGNIIGLEFTPNTCSEIFPSKDVIVHTNHFCDPSFIETDLTLSILPDTVKRFDRAQKLIDQKEKWTSHELRDVFMDHESGPTSICRHVDTSVPMHLQTETVGSFVFDLFNKRIHATYGQPCRNAYQDVSLV